MAPMVHKVCSRASWMQKGSFFTKGWDESCDGPLAAIDDLPSQRRMLPLQEPLMASSATISITSNKEQWVLLDGRSNMIVLLNAKTNPNAEDIHNMDGVFDAARPWT